MKKPKAPPPKLSQSFSVKPYNKLVSFPGKPNRTSPTLDFVNYYGYGDGGNFDSDILELANEISGESNSFSPDCIKAATEWRAFLNSPGAPAGDSVCLQIIELWKDMQNLTGL